MNSAGRLAGTVATVLMGLGALGLNACSGEADTHDHETHTAERQDPWDSQAGNPTHATHSYLTERAIDALKAQYPELQTYRSFLVDGANRELHELPVSDPFEEELRVAAGGTNWAANHPEVPWQRAIAANAAGDKGQAYWYVGVVLHYVEDMGVPAHAFHVIHQGTFAERDNFELLGLQRWSPLYDALQADPGYTAPSDYVLWSGSWARSEFQSTFPGVTYTRTFFSSSWLWASSKEAHFVREREGHTAVAATYALRAAAAKLAH